MTADGLIDIEKRLERAKAAREVFLAVTDARARSEAAAYGARLQAGGLLGPLDGATVSWKDMIAVAGVVTTAGSRTRLGMPAESCDAPVVQRGASSGLITIGTTNLSEFAFSGVGHNPHFGTPLLDGRVPGGSSSGAAASVARGLVRLAVGTDTAGSCRVPAAFHGLFGFRPTQGRYPMDGVLPLAPDFDTVGLITGTAEDLRDLDAVLNGDHSIPDQQAQIVLDAHATDSASPQVAHAVYETLAEAERAGFSCTRQPSTLLSEAIMLIDEQGWPGGIDAARTHAELISSDRFALVDPLVASRLERAAGADRAAMDSVRRAAQNLRQRWPQQSIVVALPTVALMAPYTEPLLSDPELYSRVNADILRLTMAASLLDLPAVTLPVAQLAQGQWCGLQLVGAPNKDRELLTLACALAGRLCIRGHRIDP